MSAHLLYGDSFLVPRAFRAVVDNAGAAGLLESNSHSLQGSQVKPAELISICNALPFMDSRRLVVVAGLLTVYGRRSGGRRSRSRDAGSAAQSLGGWEALAEVVPLFPESTVLVLTDGPIADGNPMLRLLRPICQVQALAAPSGTELARWIKATAQDKGASISPAAVRRLSDLVGSDLWTLDQELEKLSLFASGRSIEESDVQEMVAQVREANIFAAVDALIEGRASETLGMLHQLLEDGRDVSYIIAMTERQLRLLALARDYLDRGTPQRELGSRLGVSSQFVVRKTIEQAQRVTRQEIAEQYRKLLEADLAIKRGILEPSLALEVLATDRASSRR